MELPGLNPLGSMAALAVEAPMRKLQQVTRVAASDNTQGAGTDSRQRPDQESNAAEARDIAALRREMERRALPAGPPPTFRMNVLEAEGGIDQVLARIEAVRTQERDAPALRLSEQAQTDVDETKAETAEAPATAPAGNDSRARSDAADPAPEPAIG